MLPGNARPSLGMKETSTNARNASEMKDVWCAILRSGSCALQLERLLLWRLLCILVLVFANSDLQSPDIFDTRSCIRRLSIPEEAAFAHIPTSLNAKYSVVPT